MSRNPVLFVLLALFAGVAGGAAASFLLRSAASSVPAPPPRREKEPAADPAARVEALAESLNALRLELDDVRLRVERVERTAERAGRVPVPAEPRPREAAPPGTERSRPPPERGVPLRSTRVVPPRAETLRSMPEKSRYDKIREDLGLSEWQIEELKRISENLAAELRSARDGADSKELVAIHARARDLVANVLEETQRKRFDDEGYADSIDLGPELTMPAGAIRDPRDPPEGR